MFSVDSFCFFVVSVAGFLWFFLIVFLIALLMVFSCVNVIALYHAKVVVSRIFFVRGKRY